ncbi:MAG TPA: ATP-dependent DNA helicase, partial [Rhodospirillaceae bacterium]|nr:ATP-dependent DNA helicase [Rhodospirillaceae bacterium]
WILGPEGGAVRSRRKGLARRAEGLVEGDEAAEEALRAVLRAARDLAGAGWSERLAAPRGPGEAFLAACAAQIAAAGPHHGAGFGKEALAHPAPPALAEAAVALAEAFSALEKPMVRLAARLLALGQAPDLDPDDRARTEALARALAFRAEHHLAPWRVALGALDGSGSEEAFCDILVAEPEPGADLGLARHWVDPMRPFARAIDPRADGIALTSATLRDGRGLGAWGMATLRSGAVHLAHGHARTAAFPSPFAYVDCARVFVVTDVDRADSGAVAGAMRALFEAAGGGALGLFTAISRLKATRARIAAPLEAAGLPLYAQHVDEMDVGTLLDLFRAEEDSCLLGTDAVRDGVDVPGRALRLLVMDRVPWPRPGLLHRARRAAFGARAWDDASTRLRLTQAFGRLVRREGDRGVFVLLDPRLPSRLADAFPEGVEVRRLGLQAVLREVGGFLQEEV